MTDIPAFLTRYGWSYEELEPGLWRTSFATENDEEFDLYLFTAEDWVHFAVSPFLPPLAEPDRPRLHAALLRINQNLHLARFALDEDGDVNLLADVPAQRLTFNAFAQVLELLVFYADRLAGELRRLATQPGYHSPLFDE